MVDYHPTLKNRPTLKDRLVEEFNNIFTHAKDNQDLVEPTDDEAANGWTAEALTEYLAERTAGQSIMIDPRSLHSRVAKRSRYANNKYNPLRWR